MTFHAIMALSHKFLSKVQLVIRSTFYLIIMTYYLKISTFYVMNYQMIFFPYVIVHNKNVTFDVCYDMIFL